MVRPMSDSVEFPSFRFQSVRTPETEHGPMSQFTIQTSGGCSPESKETLITNKEIGIDSFLIQRVGYEQHLRTITVVITYPR
jgi:hypothetical protein